MNTLQELELQRENIILRIQELTDQRIKLEKEIRELTKKQQLQKQGLDFLL